MQRTRSAVNVAAKETGVEMAAVESIFGTRANGLLARRPACADAAE
ncbi:MAG: hypothetical protein ACXWZ1_11160 [Gaiellaceae bacterium]